jgi:hypothetical protein
MIAYPGECIRVQSIHRQVKDVRAFSHDGIRQDAYINAFVFDGTATPSHEPLIQRLSTKIVRTGNYPDATHLGFGIAIQS